MPKMYQLLLMEIDARAAGASGDVSASAEPMFERLSFLATGETISASGTAIISIQGTNMPATQPDDVEVEVDRQWVELGTITLDLTDAVDDDLERGFVTDAAWQHIRAVATRADAGAYVQVWMGQVRKV